MKLQAAESGTPGVPGGIQVFWVHQVVPGSLSAEPLSQAEVHQGGHGG